MCGCLDVFPSRSNSSYSGLIVRGGGKNERVATEGYNSVAQHGLINLLTHPPFNPLVAFQIHNGPVR